jgi:mono/diheme cytochrome c family protein
MQKKWVWVIGLLIMIGLFASADLARAGGWATVTVSELPTEIVAERPFTVEFSVRGHGQTLVAGLDAAVTAVHETSDTRVNVPAEDGAEEGFYTAPLTLPEAGEWRWEISTYGRAYPMPSLMVNEAAVVASVESGGGTAVAWQLILAWTAAAGTILCLFFWSRQRNRLRLAGAVLLGVVSLAGFGLYAQMPQPVLAENEAAMVPAIAPEAMGEALFVAKGCIQCHTNNNVTMTDNLLPFGPNITFVKRSPEYLQAWLANPSALKTDTQMPNLHLSEAEIDTLVAFLQTDAD